MLYLRQYKSEHEQSKDMFIVAGKGWRGMAHSLPVLALEGISACYPGGCQEWPLSLTLPLLPAGDSSTWGRETPDPFPTGLPARQWCTMGMGLLQGEKPWFPSPTSWPDLKGFRRKEPGLCPCSSPGPTACHCLVTGTARKRDLGSVSLQPLWPGSSALWGQGCCREGVWALCPHSSPSPAAHHCLAVAPAET